jgi:hypothetical protein
VIARTGIRFHWTSPGSFGPSRQRIPNARTRGYTRTQKLIIGLSSTIFAFLIKRNIKDFWYKEKAVAGMNKVEIGTPVPVAKNIKDFWREKEEAYKKMVEMRKKAVGEREEM